MCALRLAGQPDREWISAAHTAVMDSITRLIAELPAPLTAEITRWQGHSVLVITDHDVRTVIDLDALVDAVARRTRLHALGAPEAAAGRLAVAANRAVGLAFAGRTVTAQEAHGGAIAIAGPDPTGAWARRCVVVRGSTTAAVPAELARDPHLRAAALQRSRFVVLQTTATDGGGAIIRCPETPGLAPAAVASLAGLRERLVNAGLSLTDLAVVVSPAGTAVIAASPTMLNRVAYGTPIALHPQAAAYLEELDWDA